MPDHTTEEFIDDFMIASTKAGARAAIDAASAAQLTAEIANRSNADSVNAAAIAQEIADRVAGDAALEVGLTGKIAEARKKIGGRLASKATVTFVDDDGALAAYTKLKPLAVAGTPFVLAIVKNYTEAGSLAGYAAMSKAQISEMVGYGCEVAGHSVSHQSHVAYTKAQADVEVHGSMDYVAQWGGKNYVFPFGAQNNEVLKSVSEVADSSCIVGGGVNHGALDTFKIKRVALGSYAGANNTLAYYRSQVDEAVAQGGMLVFMLHCWEPQHDATQQQHLIDLIAYINGLSDVSITTLKGAMEVHGNAVEQDPTSDRSTKFAVSASGGLRTTSLEYVHLTQGSRNVNSVPSDFPFGESEMITLAANNGGFPDVGVVITKRPVNESNQGGLTTQFLYGYAHGDDLNAGNVWKRAWQNDGMWSKFVMIGTSTKLASGSVTATTPASGYAPGHSYMTKSGGADGGWPTLNGTLYHYGYSTENGFPHQEWRVYNSTGLLRRHWTTGGAWSEWEVSGLFNFPTNNKGINSPVSDFPLGISWCKHSFGSPMGMPNGAGRWKVERDGENGYSRATWYEYNSAKIYTCYGKTDNTWSELVELEPETHDEIFGVIRPNGSGGWAFINDVDHAFKGFSPTVTTTATGITVNFPATTKVGTLIVTPDEYFGKHGLTAGVSVGLSSAEIQISGLNVSAYVTYDGTNFAVQINNGVNSPGGVVVDPNGEITVSHLPTGDLASVNVNARNYNYAVRRGSVSETSTSFSFVDIATGSTVTALPNDLQFFFNVSGGILSNPQLMPNTGNLWLYGKMKK